MEWCEHTINMIQIIRNRAQTHVTYENNYELLWEYDTHFNNHNNSYANTSKTQTTLWNDMNIFETPRNGKKSYTSAYNIQNRLWHDMRIRQHL